MLTAIQENSQKKVNALSVEKEASPFSCPECGTNVILKKGLLKTPHFAHKPPVTCDYGSGESEEHRRCKSSIFENASLLADVDDCEIEKSFGAVRPDIYIKFKSGLQVAIEVQLSTLTLEKIIQRTSIYEELDIYTLWIPSLKTSGLDKKCETYSPKSYERWLHQTYYGRVYYWVDSLILRPVVFDTYKLYVPETKWGGGYYKDSKRYVTPVLLDTVSFPSDFYPRHRGAWGVKIYTPNSKIMLGRDHLRG